MTQTLSKVERIETKIDNKVTQQLAISGEVGGMAFRNMDEVMNFAKLMAISDVAVPKHIRENVGACLAVCVQAIEWRMSPYAVANKSYIVNDRLCFESQLVHAVIEQRAPIQGRLRNRYVGEGDQRRCVVWATPKGETDPLEYQSPETGRITPKNSPLWKTKPDLQLFYNASRDWARMYYPDVIMGVYTEDELNDAPKAVTRTSIPMPRALEDNRTLDTSTSQIETETEEQERLDDEEHQKQVEQKRKEGESGASAPVINADASEEEFLMYACQHYGVTENEMRAHLKLNIKTGTWKDATKASRQSVLKLIESGAWPKPVKVEPAKAE